MSGVAGTEIKTKAGDLVTREREAFARAGLALLGLSRGDANYELALDAGRRGWRAETIRARLADPKLIYELFGRAPE